MSQKHLAILAHGASGTSVLYEYLRADSSKVITCRKEMLLSHIEGTDWYDDLLLPLMIDAESKNKILPIHIKPSQLQSLGITLYDAVSRLSERFNFVFIERSNYVASAVSTIGKKQNKKNIKELAICNDYVSPDKLTLHEKDYLRAIKLNIRSNDVLKMLLVDYPCYYVNYEKHINVDDGPRQVAINIMKYFGFYSEVIETFEPLRYNYHSVKNKWSDMKIKDRLTNFHLIEQQLTDTDFEWMLYE